MSSSVVDLSWESFNGVFPEIGTNDCEIMCFVWETKWLVDSWDCFGANDISLFWKSLFTLAVELDALVFSAILSFREVRSY